MFSFNSPSSQTKVRSPLSALKQMEEDLTYWFLSHAWFLCFRRFEVIWHRGDINEQNSNFNL